MPSYVLITPPSGEPVTIAEAQAQLRLDEGSVEPSPNAPTVALAFPVAPGNVDNGAHRYLATFVTSTGETQAGTPSAVATVVDKTINGQVVVSSIPLGGSSVTARKLYRTQANGSAYLYHSTIADNTTVSLTDNIADAALGAGAPSANTTGDPLLAMYIAAARVHAEMVTQRQFMTATWKLVLDAFPGMSVSGIAGVGEGRSFPRNAILLNKSPIQSVASIRYMDMSGAWQIMPTTDYVVDISMEPARITPVFGKIWPITLPQIAAIEVTFTAGYGAAANVPMGIKHWILVRVDSLFKNRGETTEVMGKLEKLPFFDGLLDPFTVVTY